MISGIGHPCVQRKPTSALARPRVEATERSISPVMMMNVSGRVMIATSPTEMHR